MMRKIKSKRRKVLNKLEDDCKATGIMPILLYAILLSVAPKKMTDDRKLFVTMPNGRWQLCVDLSYGHHRRTETAKGMKKKEKKKGGGIVSTGVKGGLKREEKWGKCCSHPVELIVGDLTPSPLLAGLSMNVRYSANIPD
ncbi:hypothetical protein K0M31_020008 [Melipona bicolor]|uniref:Uncharacterized protein n=1 Tax=Melipona bicolor TaxID=60889 RepID=A0AA40G0R8_9HYME|nr:hypothetical protein K0M31_020008 [Melipona bicolor]